MSLKLWRIRKHWWFVKHRPSRPLAVEIVTFCIFSLKTPSLHEDLLYLNLRSVKICMVSRFSSLQALKAECSDLHPFVMTCTGLICEFRLIP